ncbi:MAG TPA: rhodanese-like domain-containing protein [bacterium]|nr:rhodanese-like domain-containing protein [bacterium]
MLFRKGDVKRLIVRSVLLVVLGSAVGLVVNAVRTRGVDLFSYQPPSKQTIANSGRQTDAISQIDLMTALRLQKTPGVVFVDARPKVEFETGHIPGAINIPAKTFEDVAPGLKESLVKADKVVTYCSDVECDEALEVAEMLHDLLNRPILVFTGGMREYQNKGPVEK